MNTLHNNIKNMKYVEIIIPIKSIRTVGVIILRTLEQRPSFVFLTIRKTQFSVYL